MSSVLCLISSRTVFRSTPATTRCEAKVCRRSWKRKSLMPATSKAARNERYTLSRRPGRGEGLGSLAPLNRLQITTAVLTGDNLLGDTPAAVRTFPRRAQHQEEYGGNHRG